jgi:protein O-mannosyl-transferase
MDRDCGRDGRLGGTLPPVLSCAGILVLVAILYWPVLDYSFLALDDEYGVATNPGIRDLSLRTVRFLFFEDQRDFRYFPLAYLSFAVDYALSGLDAGAFHRTNLLLHLANTALVFGLIRTLSRDTLAAAVASLLFGLHPLQVESVAWVSSRKNVLFLFFFLLSIFAYLGYVRTAPARRAFSLGCLAGSVLLFFLSITAKTTAVTLPAVLLLIDYALAPQQPRRPIAFALRHLPSKLIYIPPIVFAWEMTNRLSRQSPFRMDVSFDIFDWAVIIAHNLFFYVAKTLAPIRLGVFYPLPNNGQPWLPLHFYLYALLGIALLGLCIWSFGRWRWIFFGTSFYLVTLFPSAIQAAFFHDLPLLAADRYFYQSSIALFLLVGLGVSAAWRRLAAAPGWARVAVALVAFSAAAETLWPLASQQVQAFRDTIPLYEQTVRYHPSDAFYYRLAIEYADAGQMDSAFHALDQAESAPDKVCFLRVFNYQMRLSDLYRRKGDFRKAAEFLARAIDSTPNAIEPASTTTPLAFRYLAWLYDQAGDPVQAEAARALAGQAKVDPRSYFESYWFVMASDAALPFLERRVDEAPMDAVAWYYLGQGYRLNGQPARSEACLRRAQALGFPP